MGTHLFKKGRRGASCLTGKKKVLDVVVDFVHLRATQTLG